MTLRYRCILIDHDDTAVDSTAAIHYPAHVEALRVLRPGRTPPSSEEWILRNFHGIMDYLVNEPRADAGGARAGVRHLAQLDNLARSALLPRLSPAARRLPRGGREIAVVSHSEADVIASHYRAPRAPRCGPTSSSGGSNDERSASRARGRSGRPCGSFDCDPADALIVDDLKPGVLMSREAGVAFAAAGWGHRIPEIETYMRANAALYCASIDELRDVLLPA